LSFAFDVSGFTPDHPLPAMFTNTVAIEISAPPETIFAYLVDFTRHKEWSSNVRRIELIAGEMGKVGAEYQASEDVPRNLTSVTFHPLSLPARLILYLIRAPRVEKENRASLERIKTILEK
jgi:hypothetical protein